MPLNLNQRLLLLLGIALLSFPFHLDARPLPNAHAHNDYEHPRPLLDALEHGFCSVEADIHLVDGQLLVAHDRDQVRPGRTLQNLYLDPLLERARKNQGRIYPESPEFILLIDIKSGAEETYELLAKVLEDYREMLTRFTPDKIERRAVTAILSGNRPREMLEKQKVRYAAMDGRLSDLETNPPLHLVPMVSDNWRPHFTWRGEGQFPEAERKALHDIVKKAHGQGRLIRFWASPDRAESWREQCRAGVDLINTDRLGPLREFLLNHSCNTGLRQY
jgi:glycerophosphoryl diester phosphodiesterase